MSKILITGATGFINANLSRKMLKEGHSAYVLLRKQSNLQRIQDVLPDLNVLEADLLDFETLREGIHKIGPDYIFHSATYGSYPDDQQDEDLIVQTNVVGTYNLLKAANEISYKCFIYTGSSSEYGFKDKPMAETDLLEPESLYGVSKASATLLCQMFAKRFHKNIQFY